MNLQQKIKAVSSAYRKLEKDYLKLGTKIAQLTAAGCINAKVQWRNGKYMTLIYPMNNGERRTKYIGCHPLRIKEAEQKLENFNTRFEYIVLQEEISKKIDDIDKGMDSLLRVCSSFDIKSQVLLNE